MPQLLSHGSAVSPSPSKGANNSASQNGSSGTGGEGNGHRGDKNSVRGGDKNSVRGGDKNSLRGGADKRSSKSKRAQQPSSGIAVSNDDKSNNLSVVPDQPNQPVLRSPVEDNQRDQRVSGKIANGTKNAVNNNDNNNQPASPSSVLQSPSRGQTKPAGCMVS